MKAPHASPARRFPRSAVALPLLGIALGALALVVALSVVGRFAPMQIPQRTHPRYRAFTEAPQAALSAGSPAARDAFSLILVADAFTDALRSDARLMSLDSQLVAGGADCQTTRADELYRLATRILRLERSHEPLERWWSHVQPLLPPADANADHHLDALWRVWSAAYADFGLSDGAAAELAAVRIGHPHGPLLQYLSPALGRVADERRARGDVDGAAKCETLRVAVLKAWTLAPGPAGLRLLAADLLAAALEQQPRTDADQQIARDLRAWRAAYLDAARKLPVDFLSMQSDPAFDADAYRRALRRLAVLSWLSSAMIASAAAALVLLPLWLVSDRQRLPRLAPLSAVAAGCALLSIVAAAAWPSLWPALPLHDFRSDFSSLRYVWVHPLLATGLVWAAVFIGTFVVLRLRRAAPAPRVYERLGACAAAAAWTWLLLSVAVLISAVAFVEPARQAVDAANARARADEVAAIAGPQADALLNSLRAAQP